MDGLLKAGRIIFAIAMVFFGVEFLLFLTGMKGPIPGPPWTHTTLALDWLACVGFILAGVSLATGKMVRLVSMLLGAVLLLYVLFRYVPTLLARLHDPGPWTVVFEILALAGGAFVLARSFSRSDGEPALPEGVMAALAIAGRFLIAISLAVFAVQHFLYARFVGDLIPGWIPAHVFFAYFTGAAFVAAALAFATKMKVRLAGVLLGTMFLIWVFVLHVPRVAGAWRNGDEVTSLFVAVAMCGLSFALAGAEGHGRR
jgi:hypothetical protein